MGYCRRAPNSSHPPGRRCRRRRQRRPGEEPLLLYALADRPRLQARQARRWPAWNAPRCAPRAPAGLPGPQRWPDALLATTYPDTPPAGLPGPQRWPCALLATTYPDTPPAGLPGRSGGQWAMPAHPEHAIGRLTAPVSPPQARRRRIECRWRCSCLRCRRCGRPCRERCDRP